MLHVGFFMSLTSFFGNNFGTRSDIFKGIRFLLSNNFNIERNIASSPNAKLLMIGSRIKRDSALIFSTFISGLGT